jgi:protein lysine acetyltransferase
VLPGDDVLSDRDAIVADLARCDVLTAATRPDLESLAKLLTPFAAPAGTVLLRRGDVAGHFLLMTSGRARVAAGEEEGAQKVAVVAEGSILGEMALLRGTRPSATVTAMTETRGLKGGQAAFTRLLAIPGVLEKVVTTARQRLAADMVPVPVTLRDGTAAGLRPVYPGDQQELMRGEQFSAQTRYRRFLGREQVPPALARYLTEVDYVDHFAWVALCSVDVWAGGATYVRSASDRALADISFLITDEFQGRGLGTLLMGAVAIAARRNGIARFSADVLAENAPMRAILRRAGMEWETMEAGVMHGLVAVPDPGTFGIASGTAAALAAIVDDMNIRP